VEGWEGEATAEWQEGGVEMVAGAEGERADVGGL
jgi:hypothetical protein